MQRIVASNAGKSLKFAVSRDGKVIETMIVPEVFEETRELDIKERFGRVWFMASFPAAVIGVPSTKSPARTARGSAPSTA